jgi:hypothetical protein
MEDKILFTFKNFTGQNNVDETYRLPTGSDRQGRYLTDMAVLQNVDVDNQLAVETRVGSEKKLAGTGFHSLWASGEICLYVSGSSLCRLTKLYASETLLSGLALGARMSYAEAYKRVYFTNGHHIGYYDGSAVYALPNPTQTYKLPLPAGRFIFYYQGRLYVAKGNILYISDALCDHYDIRDGFRVFGNDITMCGPVDSGIYVSDGKTWFIAGEVPGEFKRTEVLGVGSVPFTAVATTGEFIGDGASGNVLIWVSDDGICLGDNNGAVKLLTKTKYTIPSSAMGWAAIRRSGGEVHYIVTLNE